MDAAWGRFAVEVDETLGVDDVVGVFVDEILSEEVELKIERYFSTIRNFEKLTPPN